MKSCLPALSTVCPRPTNLSPEVDKPAVEAEHPRADKQNVRKACTPSFPRPHTGLSHFIIHDHMLHFQLAQCEQKDQKLKIPTLLSLNFKFWMRIGSLT